MQPYADWCGLLANKKDDVEHRKLFKHSVSGFTIMKASDNTLLSSIFFMFIEDIKQIVYATQTTPYILVSSV